MTHGRQGAIGSRLACALLLLAAPAAAAPRAAPDPVAARTIALPGPRYLVLRSGPAAGLRPTRADEVAIRYVGRLRDGSVFITSAANGTGISRFPVKGVIPGFMALVRLMRPGDRWRFFLPAYLAYGAEGKTYRPGDPNLKRDIPPDAPLAFDVELVSVISAR